MTRLNPYGGRSHLPVVIERVARRLRAHLTLAVVGAAAALLLYGSFSDWELGRMLLLLVALRGAWLLRDALRRPMRDGDWDLLYGELVARYEHLSPADLAAEAGVLGAADAHSVPALATAAVAAARHAYAPPRPGSDLAAEAVGLVTFALLIPSDIALYTRPFVFMPSEFGWLPPLVAGVSLALYVWPLLAPATSIGRLRTLWWTLPAMPAAALAIIAVTQWHPYLNPLRPDRQKLAAERVLSLGNNVIGGAYVGWVVAYARTLEAQGDVERARWLYRESLRLDPLHTEARQRLGALEPMPVDAVEANAAAVPGPEPYMPEVPSHAPLWTVDDRATPLQRCRVDDSLSAVKRTGVVIVRAGAVPDWLVDVVGAVLGRELSLPVCVADPALVLPPPTRRRGIVIGDQWSLHSLLQAFSAQPLPASPVFYVMLTGVPIYQPGTQFLFSRTFPWGAIVSFNQFGSPELPNPQLANRTAKSTLGALLKAFGVPMSTDLDCVTSYSKSLQELDAKGNHPNAATFAAYRQALVARDRRWAAHRRVAQAR